MDGIPPFVRKYVSKTYYDRLDWKEKTAYLKGIQDVMDCFSKDLENRAMQVLQRKAHWLEPRGMTSSSSSLAPIEYSSASHTTLTQQTSALTTSSSSAAPKPVPTPPATTSTTLNNARALPKTWQSSQQSLQSSQQSTQSSQQSLQSPQQSTQPSQQSTQSSSQPLKGSQTPTSSQLSQNVSQSQSSQSSTSQPHLKRKATETAPFDAEITFVGMRYRSGHVFSPSDQVRLERDHKNPVDKNAVKVMVLKNGRWDHAAYVGRDDASLLKDQLGIEHMKLTYLRAYLASVKYRLQA